MGTLFAVSFSLFLMAGIGFGVNPGSTPYDKVVGYPTHNGVWYMQFYVGNYSFTQPNPNYDPNVEGSKEFVDYTVTLFEKPIGTWEQLQHFDQQGFESIADRMAQAYTLYQIYWAVLPIWISAVSIVAAFFGLWALGKYVISPWVKKNLAKVNNSDNINSENH